MVHTGRISEANGRLEVEKLSRLSIRIVEQAAFYPRAFDIARSLGWARAYDALYLAAAEIEDAELLTVHRGMSEAAAGLGIPATLVR